MKVCPKCNATYSDVTLKFCLQDGSTLQEPGGEFVTEEFPENETLVSGNRPNRISFDISQPEQETFVAQAAPEIPARGPRTFLTIVLTAFVTLLLLSVIGGIAAYFLVDWNSFRAGRSTTSGDPQRGTNSSNGSTDPTVTPKPDTGSNTNKDKEPKPDRKEIVQEVSRQLASWKALLEARDLKPYMQKYASRLERYYTKRNVTRTFVEADKRRAFRTYTTIRTKFDRISVTPSSDGKRATAEFDKEWDFRGGGKRNRGKVRSRIGFQKVGENWLIVSERDIKVYYVRKY